MLEYKTDTTDKNGGNIWIIIAVAVIAIGGVVALFIVKKKRKPADEIHNS